MKKLSCLVIALVLCPFALNLLAQSTGKIMGKVTDKATGEVIPYANVVINGTSLGAATDESGRYVITNVPPRLYNITASCIGYQKVVYKDARVNVGFTCTVNFELSSGQVQLQAVVVQGERNPLIRQDLTNPTVAITSESIDVLPVDNISDVIKLQAGVVTGDDGLLHMRGGRSDEVGYSLNGLSMNDPYGNSRSVGVATNAVQEVSVSTGTFAAEFGNALSGIVNYVTKEGGENIGFSLRAYAGDYLTNNKSLFYNIDKIDPLNRGRVEATLGGPVPFSKSTKFFISGIYENFKGSYYGQRIYNTTDGFLTPDNFKKADSRWGSATGAYVFNPFQKGSNGQPTGDGSAVAMNPSHSYNIQGNISQRFGPFKVRYEAVLDRAQSKDYERSYYFNPDGVGTDYSRGIVQTLDLTHTVSNSTFYTIKASYSWNKEEHYLYEDINDSRYMPNFYSRTIGNTIYYAGGTDNYISHRTTETMGIKGDLVTELFDSHEVKAGFEYRAHNIKRDGESLQFFKAQNVGGNIQQVSLNVSDMLYDSTLTMIRSYIPDASTYSLKPSQGAAYVQDKIELAKTLILNMGLRYEFFDPSSDYNYQISKDLTEEQSGYMNKYMKKASIKHMFSPRFSVSYPITDKGVIRFSYGHFYQVGALYQLYSNYSRRVENIGTVPTFGNPDIKPQKSVQYELGLQQQLTDDIKFDLTGYYKDVRDYIFTQSVYTEEGRQYNILTNLAYSNVRGITFSLLKRRSPGSLFSATLDYTYQIAEGNRTEPQEDLFFSEASGHQAETYLVPLSFDRSHLINGTVTLSEPNDWSMGLIFNLQTGTPYTPALPPSLSTVTYIQNTGNKPMDWDVDLKLEKFFKLGPINYSIFMQVYNLFDTENEYYVYASSGRALSNVEESMNAHQFDELRGRVLRGDKGMLPLSAIDNYYSQRPENVSRPREVRVGFSVLFN